MVVSDSSVLQIIKSQLMLMANTLVFQAIWYLKFQYLTN